LVAFEAVKYDIFTSMVSSIRLTWSKNL
jgi:hypothetical protein